MYIIVYAVKQSHKEVISSYNQVAVEERVPILVMSSTRAKRDAKCVQPTLLENGAVGFKNLQFQYSTQNAKKNESIQVQQYFRVVVSLVAISQEKEPQHYHLMSRMSPPIIVRGQNPGKSNKIESDSLSLDRNQKNFHIIGSYKDCELGFSFTQNCSLVTKIHYNILIFKY
jgi:5-hydroxyisourate hydrolase-like protein (transthyretin family)